MKIFIRSTALILSSAFLLAGCGSSHPIIPDARNVKATREDVDKNCRSLGNVMGRTDSLKPDVENAIEDLKKEAALKGANVVHVETVSGLQSAVTGTAYFCP